MTGIWIFQTLLFLTILTIVAFALGEYMAQVFTGERNILSPVLAPVEKGIYKLFGVNPKDEMHWKTYATNLLLFNLIGLIAIFVLQEIQQWLPLNPQNLGAVRWDRAINTAISYTTNTNWQPYKGETALSYLSQMLGLGLQNFLSAATGIAVGVAFITGFSRKTVFSIGNFWVDLTRAILYLLLPLAIILSLLLVSQGVVQNLHPYVLAHTLQGHNQLIAQGPAAARVAIKHLGTNGGGFFNVNSAHPYENPTPFSDYLEIFSMLLIAASFPFAFGAMMGNRKQGWAIFLAMMLLFIAVLGITMVAEFHGNPILEKIGVHHGINMEGKEERLGPLSSVVFSMATTATSTGAANSMHGSFMPLSILVMIFNMASGEAIFGGVGAGFVSMLLYAILSMFLIGLMIGRSPEIYGKKLEPREMVITCIALMLPPVIQLILGAIAIATPSAVASTSSASLQHGLTEIIYSYASSVGNNGSNLNGINADTVFYNLTTGFAMLAGRALSMLAPLAIAGYLAQKNIIPITSRFPTASTIFVIILACMVVVIGALTFMPVLVIGPVLEHFALQAGKLL